MVMPKGFLTNIDIHNHKIGFPRRQEILDDIADKGTFLPRGVLIEDMDGALVEYLEDKKGLSISIEGEKVPVIVTLPLLVNLTALPAIFMII